MNRNTRIFFYGVVLIGLGILLIYTYSRLRLADPGQSPEILLLGLVFEIVGLAISGRAAFRADS